MSNSPKEGGRVGTHWEGCEQSHHECAWAKLAASGAELVEARTIHEKLREAEYEQSCRAERAEEKNRYAMKLMDEALPGMDPCAPFEACVRKFVAALAKWRAKAEENARERDAEAKMVDLVAKERDALLAAIRTVMAIPSMTDEQLAELKRNCQDAIGRKPE